ncbi:MAG: hypothetical protein KJ630_15460 [Proteobacteria bacterium]|nr:hypothetical protein [Pseudomonadota bacterium]
MSVSGTVTNLQSMIGVRFDSGRGLNGYEWERYPLQPLPVDHDSDGISLIITRTGVHHPASLGANVILRSVYIDQKKYVPSKEQLSPGVELNDGALLFTKDGATLRLRVHPKSSLILEFPASNSMGMVDVQIGEKTTRTDLYGTNDARQWGGRYAKFVQSWFVTEKGQFTVSMPMPRYKIHTLRAESNDDFSLSSAAIAIEDGTTINLEGSEHQKGFNFPMSGINKQLKRNFHPDRFLFQIFFALLSTWLLSNVVSYAGRFRGIKDIFINEQRHLFWLMLSFSCMLFSFWHVAFWPGVTSNDSLEIWRAAQIPGTYLGDHPPLNVAFYLYLSHFWNNVAIVPFVQNFLTSLLISYIFFSLLRKGMPLYCLLPLYTLTVFSLPVGLYTIILWKDIPFALIVVLVGFKLAVYNLEKINKTLHVSPKEWFTLFCLTLALVGFRHNGVLYVFIVPFIILLFGIVRIRPLVLGILFSAAVVLGSLIFLFPGSSKTSGFLASQTKTYLTQAMNQISLKYLEESGKKYFGIFNVNQKDMQWDLVHLCMYGRYTNDFLRNLRWNDVYPYLPPPSKSINKKIAKTAWAIYWKSYQAPWVYFSWNPVYMLVLFPLLPLLFRVLPMTSVFSLYIFIPMAVLVFLNIFNWRYYYFAYLACYFIFPLIVTDFFSRNKRNASIA